jgi:hypothetical protein
MAITFSVDDVKLEGELYPVATLDESLPERIREGLCFSQGPASVVQVSSFYPFVSLHPLVGAVHLAFSEHRPLVLSPDAIWMTIAQGFSAHVQIHAEELRERFVRHAGKKTLKIETEREPDAAAWTEWIPQFTSMIRDHVGAGLYRLLLNDFSTTGAVERIASEIGMMDCFSPYFDYEAQCVCGIPEITLTGTVEDWKSIRRRLDVVAEYGLADWIAKLAPVADEWVKTAEGHPDRDFWQCMYMPEETYGTKLVTGWLIRLFPYLDSKGERNESLYRPAPQPDQRRRVALWDRTIGAGGTPPKESVRRLWLHEGIKLARFGHGISVARVVVTYIDGRPAKHFDLFGGLIGVTQDSSTLALEPRLGWCVRFDRDVTLIKRLAATARPAMKNNRRGMRFSAEGIPDFYLKLLKEVGDSRALFDGLWTLATREQMDTLVAPTGEKTGDPTRAYYGVTPFADLPDGRWLAWHRIEHFDQWCVVIGHGAVAPSLDSTVIAPDFMKLFEDALHTGPLFFDAKSFRAENTLRDFI